MVAKTPKEVLEKEFLRTADIRVLIGCSEENASKIMKEVKLFQDSTGGLLRGVCHINDLKAWMKHNREKGKVRSMSESLRDLRLQNKMTCAEVASALGVTKNAVTNYESGVRNISLEQIIKLATLFDCTEREIIDAALNSRSAR